MLSFKTSKQDAKLINQIVDRAMSFHPTEIEYDRLSCHMDITAYHANGNPLRLAELLEADDFNFIHYVFGIARHINRETGQLEGFFVPRFSAPVHA